MIDFLMQTYGPWSLIAAGAGVALLLSLAVMAWREVVVRRCIERQAGELAVLVRERDESTRSAESTQEEAAGLREDRRRLEADNAALTARCERVPQLEAQLAEARDELARARNQATQLKVSLDEQRRAMDEKLALLEKAKAELSTNFENLANRILDEKGKKFGELHSERLQNLLNPVREQMTSFQKTVMETHREDTKERSMLREQLTQIRDLNQQLSEDALNLTRALRGDSKARGNWGEMTLQRILEASGLAEGREYSTQSSYRDADNRIKRPDVIIQLPEGKQVVVDSKVTLNAYTELCEAEDDDARAKALARHVAAMRSHVVGLGRKDYSGIETIESLEFVLMFVPIEGAYIEAINNDPDLFDDAFSRHRVAIVCPSTLFGTLKTIAAMWRMEHRSRNAEEIARQAGALYDKFVGFVEALDAVGSNLDRARRSWDDAVKRLSEGKDNLVRKTERLRELGAPTTKELPAEYRIAVDE